MYVRPVAVSLPNLTFCAAACFPANRGAPRRKRVVIAVVAALAGVLLLLSVVCCCVWWWRRKRHGDTADSSAPSGGDDVLPFRARKHHPALEEDWKTGDQDVDLPLFDLAVILAATNSFSVSNKIGEGGFGPVYMVRTIWLTVDMEEIFGVNQFSLVFNGRDLHTVNRVSLRMGRK